MGKSTHIKANNDTLKLRITLGNNPMVGASVACAVAVQEAMTK